MPKETRELQDLLRAVRSEDPPPAAAPSASFHRKTDARVLFRRRPYTRVLKLKYHRGLLYVSNIVATQESRGTADYVYDFLRMSNSGFEFRASLAGPNSRKGGVITFFPKQSVSSE
eukprot:4346453-Pyramimonas_sp.AAC.1